MKKIILALTCCIAILAACNNETKTSENKDSVTFAPDPATTETAPATADTTTTKATTAAAPAAPAEAVGSEKGKALIAKSDCLGCHKLNEKLVGPAYADVAKKYTSADIDKLSGKIIAGGAGVWGQVPMSPHPALSKDDAKEMVKYILSVK